MHMVSLFMHSALPYSAETRATHQCDYTLHMNTLGQLICVICPSLVLMPIANILETQVVIRKDGNLHCFFVSSTKSIGAGPRLVRQAVPEITVIEVEHRGRHL